MIDLIKRLPVLWFALSILVFYGCSVKRNGSGPPQNAHLFERLKYLNDTIAPDLGVGLWAWPLPMDYDDDGDMDLLVSCRDVPFNGLWFFENKSGEAFPVFEPPIRVGEALRDIQVSYIDEKPRFLQPGRELLNFTTAQDANPEMLFPADTFQTLHNKIRFNQWKYVDYEHDGDIDIVVGIQDGEDYGWDNAFDENGVWVNGPLHGFVYLIENVEGSYKLKGKIHAGGKPIDVYGAPSPNFADFDNDGDLDIICGEFLDKFTWFENTGTRENPVYAEGRHLQNDQGIIKMDLEMIIPVALDWDNDGDIDLIVGDEDGRVAYIENTGEVHDRMPVFGDPRYFKQKSESLKFGALATPFSIDWDDDGDEDLICGNSAGYIGFIENLDGGDPPSWAAPVLLEDENGVIRIQAGESGSIQGPCEAKWGYTTLSVADWNNDGLNDIIVNSIWGQVICFENIGEKGNPRLSIAKPVEVNWPGHAPKPEWNWWHPEPNTLATQWRTTPTAIDWNKDGLIDLIMLDHEGYLSYFERETSEDLKLKPGNRIFISTPGQYDRRNTAVDEAPGSLRLNTDKYGSSGRRKLAFGDWDGDGDLDIIINSANATLIENEGIINGQVKMKLIGDLTDQKLAGHTTSPTMVDWDKNGIPDLLLGAEDGHFYYMKNPRNP
jgi:hypothetical protein